jgi:hypothetical protein
MRSRTWMGRGLSGVLLLGGAAPAAGAGVSAVAETVLEILSLDPGDCTLGLSRPWGAMAVDHVTFHDHRGPSKAVVESSGRGVRVTFAGRGETPFIASADRIRIIYRVAGRKEIDFAAQAISGGAVRVRAVDRPVAQGRLIVIGLGKRAPRDVANVSIEERKD